MNIRYANINDYEKIYPIYYEVHQLHAKHLVDYFNEKGNPLPKPYFTQIMERDDYFFLIIENEQEIVGIALLHIRETPDIEFIVKRKYALIEDFAIKTKYPNKGYGSLLMNECKKIAKEKNASSLELNVWEFNERAIKFYESKNMKTLNRKMMLKL